MRRFYQAGRLDDREDRQVSRASLPNSGVISVGETWSVSWEAITPDDVQNLSRNFLRGWWPHGSGRLVVYEAIEPTEEEATNERG